jgi:hypothetical protein
LRAISQVGPRHPRRRCVRLRKTNV